LYVLRLICAQFYFGWTPPHFPQDELRNTIVGQSDQTRHERQEELSKS
jgi:hypothetical protein